MAYSLPFFNRNKKNKRPVGLPGDPMVRQAQMVGALGPQMGPFTTPEAARAAGQGSPQRSIPQMNAGPGINDRFNSQMNGGPMLAGPPAPPIPRQLMAGGDAPAGMPTQLLTPTGPDPYAQAMAAYNPSVPNPGVPQPVNPMNDYQGMIARLASRAQNRADLYSQVMKPAVANLPPEYQQVYNASIPDTQMSLDAYTDALAGQATIAPQLETILAQQDAALKASQNTGGGGFDEILAATIADAQNKKK